MPGERTGEALDELYQAVAAPEDWPRALQRLAESLGAVGCLFTPVHPEDAALGFSPSLELIEACENHIREGWSQRDFRLSTYAKWKHRPFALEHHVSTEEDRRREPYYQEFLRPLGLLWAAVLPVSIGGRRWHLSLQRSASLDPYTLEDGEQLLRLQHHLQAALNLVSKLRGREALARLDLLEQLDCAAMLVDWRGLVTANTQAEALVGDSLRLRDGWLSAADLTSDERLQSALGAIVAPGAFSKRRVPPPVAVLRPGRRPIVIEALPMAGLVSDLFQPARALLLLTDLDAKVQPQPLRLARTFGLTPAEARLAARLAAGESLECAAEELGVTRGTTRVQLRGIFAKTDTHRQGELVALMARLLATPTAE